MSESLLDGIGPAYPDDYPALLAVWEASVRATHHFITEADITLFRQIVRDQALPAMPIFCQRTTDRKAVGFIGVDTGKIEMLFIDPAWRGKRIGQQLLAYAVEVLGATQVDVNEQNEQAIGFYQKMGFRIVGRSAVDGMGKPYPLLHMQL
ncbi:acetyltransferase [Spirosoma fluminis]